MISLGINTPSSSPSGTVSRSHLPLEAILEVILQNTRKDVLILISWKEVAKKVSLCPYCLKLLINAQLEPLFGSKVSP